MKKSLIYGQKSFIKLGSGLACGRGRLAQHPHPVPGIRRQEQVGSVSIRGWNGKTYQEGR